MTTPRQALLLSDARLTRLMQKEPDRCASISEYANATGLSTQRIIDVLAATLDSGLIVLEPAGPEIFLNTAGHGRPTPIHLPDVRANLWERLRAHGDTNYAYALWKIYRGLEFAGWRVEANTTRISAHLSKLSPAPQLGIYVDHSLAPLLLHPPLRSLSDVNGPLHATISAGATVVGVVTDAGSLDDAITATRLYYQQHPSQAATLILEAPSYHPVAVTANDAAIPTTGTGTLHID